MRPRHDPSRTEPASGIAALRRKPAASRPDRPARPEWFCKRARRERTTVTEPAYVNSYENLAFTRDDDGVIVLRFHTNGGPVIFTGRTHEDFPTALEQISLDRDNTALVITGSGDSFMDQIDGPSLARSSNRPSGRRSASRAPRYSSGCSSCRCPSSASRTGRRPYTRNTRSSRTSTSLRSGRRTVTSRIRPSASPAGTG